MEKLLEYKTQLEQFIDLEFGSAGHIVYNNTGKKENKPGHADGTKINSTTTVLKAQLNNKYIVIDADYCDLEKLALLFPSTKKTFTTQTTNSQKRHFWFQNPQEFKNIRKIDLDAGGSYDILTKGIIYEGHSIVNQPQPWRIVNKIDVATLTNKEHALIETLTAYKDIPASQLNHSFFVNREVKEIAMKVVDNKSFKVGKKYTLTNAEHNKLLRGIMNTQYREEHKSTKARLDYPDLSYTTINTMAYKLSYNAAISFTLRDTLLHLILREQYEINPNSHMSQKLLDRQILGTLPQHESLIDNSDDISIRDLIKHTDINGWGLVKFVDGPNIMYLELNTNTLKPRRVSTSDSPFISQATVLQDRLYSKEDIQLIPKVRVEDNPYHPRTSYDTENEIDIYNLATHSKYVENAVATDTWADSPVRRLVYSYFSPADADLYLHWLAHATFHTRAPQTSIMLVSAKEDRSGVGKSLLAQAIPQQLIEAGNTAAPEGADKWGNTVVGKRLLSFNDMKLFVKKDWNAITSFIRDRTTGGARRLDDMKYGMPVMSTSTITFSLSANFIPPLEEHDRRMWVVLPNQLYGTPKTKMCSQEDASWFRRNLESADMPYIEELQPFTNYLLYLYQNHRDKYDKELYERAPETQGLRIAKSTGITYSEQLPKAIEKGPQALLDMFDPKIVERWIPFILFQTRDNQCALSYRFFADMLNELHNSDNKLTPIKVAAAMQIDKSKFTTRSAHYAEYRDMSVLLQSGVWGEYSSYPLAALLVAISEETQQEYRRILSEIKLQQ